jgi:uncharacterized protein YdeI (YjbR/CyaY-like superfamily)
MKTFDPRTVARWRAWLEQHHASASEIWLVFHKQHTGTTSVGYMEALDEALCYGWIDSLVRRLDEDRYARKFTPRKSNSKWSDINRKRYAELAKAGRLAPAGKARSPETGGRYDARLAMPEKTPPYITKALKAKPTAWGFFQTLTPKQQRYAWGWVHLAKQDETRRRRLEEVIRLLSKKQKLGLK